MRDLLPIAGLALVGVAAVELPALLLLRLVRDRSVVMHIGILLAATVAATVAGVVAVAQGMFLSPHDLRVLLVVVCVAGTASILVGWWLGRRLARDAMWADEIRARERQAEAGRRELVAWVSHDLRTPLAGMRAMAEALEDRVVADPATVAEYHRRIRSETDRMAALVDDLFELSRINAGALRLNTTVVRLGDVVSDTVAAATPIAVPRRIRLLAAESGWPTVVASERELARILGNLVRNAVRFTGDGGTVTLTGGRSGDHGWVAVTDTCGGIPPGDLPRLFDVAFRGEAARTPSTGVDGGGGLGLAIVRGLVEAHDGQISVDNVDGGCRFLLRIPAAGGSTAR